MRLLFGGIICTTMLVLQSFQTYSPGNAKNMLTAYQKNVIVYFKEIALGFEFGSDTRITRKWASDINLFLMGDYSPALKAELVAVVEELNDLITDPVTIHLVNDQRRANLIVYAGSSTAYGALYPKDKTLAEGNAGMYHIYWNHRNEIVKGHIFVKTTGINPIEQRHVMREEITQALGLGRDSESLRRQHFPVELHNGYGILHY